MLGQVVFVVVLLAVLGLVSVRLLDLRADHGEVARLLGLQPSHPARFQPDLVADLPDPARRFFLFAIADGTPLRAVANIQMSGQFALGAKEDPKYLPIRAHQVLAAPEGFLWKMRAQTSALMLSGSDSGTWTRFWLGGLLPVARAGGTMDHAKSAFGRYVAEAVFWTPAAVLPGPGVTWSEVSPDTARVTIKAHGFEQSVDLQVAADGVPLRVSFMRWTNANPEGEFRSQPFGGTLSNFQRFDGFTLPTHVEAGNNFGSQEYYPFFIVDVLSVTFPDPADGTSP